MQFGSQSDKDHQTEVLVVTL